MNAKGQEASKVRKWMRRTAWSVVIALATAVVLWTVVLKVVRAQTDAVAPEVPKGARVLLYRLARSFEPGDVVVYRDKSGHAMLARVLEVDESASRLRVDRNDEQPQSVPLSKVVGRAIWTSR